MYVSLEQRNIVIDFDKIFGRDDLNFLSSFKIDNRAYYNCLDIIQSDLEEIISKHNVFAYNYLEIRHNIIEKGENYSRLEFSSDIKKLFLSDETLMKIIKDTVENEYTLSLDSITGHKINIELQVTDEINKVLLRSAIMMRLLIPLICIYPINDSSKIDLIIYDIFKEVIRVTDNKRNNSLSKIMKIINSRVFQTRYPDTVIWKYLRNMSQDLSITVKKYFKAIIVKIMPKIKRNTSTISYLDVVLKHKINYLFTYDYPISYRPLKAQTEDDEDLSELERMEINLLRKDKGSNLINKLSIIQEIKEIKEVYNVDDEFIDNYFKEIKLNTIQHYLVEVFYSSKFKLDNNKRHIQYLLFGLIQELSYNNFNLLPQMLYSNITENTRKMSNRKKLTEQIISSDKYSLVSKQYLPVQNLLNNNNPILSLMTIKSSKFTDVEGNLIDINTKVLAEEVLDFILFI